jgi:lantibiotic modifying enzyme
MEIDVLRFAEVLLMSATTSNSPYLQSALDAAAWIRSTAQPTEHGLTWLPEPANPEKSATISSPAALYSGNAGTLLFFLELAAATGDRSYLDDATNAALQIAATWHAALDHKGFLMIENGNFDFQMGVAGTAFALAQTWLATGDDRLRDAAIEIVDHIASSARPAGAGLEWIGAPTIGFGDGSIALMLLFAAKHFDRPQYREIALQAGRRIAELAVPDPRGGLKWLHPHIARFIPIEGIYMPNFELGTAGVAYVLARLHEEFGEPEFLRLARAGADHVQALATVSGDSALLFYREPDQTDLYYLGYCHGPVGTARLFYKLFQLTGNLDDLAWCERFARGIITSGAPEQQTPGLWNVVCLCCGTAGVADFFTSLYLATGKQEYLDFARRNADETIRREHSHGEHGASWPQAWTRVEPDNISAETGYMIGAAGVGTAFLRLHLAEQGAYRAILFPDNPFPVSAR